MIEKTKNESPVVSDPPSGFWQREIVYHPEPIMPIHHSVFMTPVNDAMEHAFGEFSYMARQEYRDIGGWGYAGMVRMAADDPQLLVRIKGCVEKFRNNFERQVAHLWHTEWKPIQRKRIKELQLVNIPQFSDWELTEHISDVLKPFLETSIRYQIMLELAFVWTMGKLVMLSNELTGDDPKQTIQLLAGLSPEITNPAYRISGIAREAAGNPRIKALLERPDNVSIKDITDIDPAFASILNEYLADYGCRVFHHMIHYPTFREKPTILFGLIRGQLTKGIQELSIIADIAQSRIEWLGKARAELQRRPEEDRVSFEKTWESAMQIYPLKEDCEYDTFDAPTALMRYALLELGSRMSARHHLANQEDVFFLELEEAVQAIRINKDLQQLVTQRKAAKAWTAAHPGPPFYGTPPQIPFESFPPEIQIIAKGMLWVQKHYYGFSDTEVPESESRLTGTAASSGRYTGPARIIFDESDFGKIRAGDVLVCPITTPSWAILFPNIGAIITDAGGILSHPAIIAREYGLPAVVATRDATQRLSDGQMVTVDGSTGMIEIH